MVIELMRKLLGFFWKHIKFFKFKKYCIFKKILMSKGNLQKQQMVL